MQVTFTEYVVIVTDSFMLNSHCENKNPEFPSTLSQLTNSQVTNLTHFLKQSPVLKPREQV